MTSVAWFFQDKLLRLDDLPLEWCPWHVHFCCPLCGETWAKRILMSEKATINFRNYHCPFCPTDPEAPTLHDSLLNAFEARAGYAPLEILSLDFLMNTSGVPNG
jgi:hypothetical protein